MKHCLIVDDSNSIRKVASRIVGDLSMRASEAETGEEALAACSSGMPDCILVDWQIPGTDSMELVSQLRRMPGGAKPTILYLVSVNDPKQIDRAIHCGASGHMMKPFDSDSTAQTFARAGVI